jgi:hypothetical protein
MASARPLRDVFADLTGSGGSTGDPEALLREQGHELPDDLVAEAVVSYADTAPAEVAEHLAPYVTAHSAVGAEPGDESAVGWLDLLGTAPAGPGVADGGPDDDLPAPDLDFGTGAEPGPPAATADDAEAGETGQDDLVEILADPADLDDGDPTGWAPVDPATGPAADPSMVDDGEADDAPLG